jgi:2Fe-2S ferredoxin
MANIHFILRDGSVRTVAAKDGASLMEAAIHNNISGIDAECGGCCACATCHIYLDPDSAFLAPPADEMELETLDGVSGERRANSRLSCQITVGPALEGLVVQIPAPA